MFSKGAMKTIFVILLASIALTGCARSEVLGRTKRLCVLCDNFEDKGWSYDYKNRISSNGLWRGTNKGEPESLKLITTPPGGREGSAVALEIRTIDNDYNNVNDDNHNQENFITVEFNQKHKQGLTRADQPVFIVRVWLPSFDQWVDGLDQRTGEFHYSFGFRQAPRWSNTPESEYYPSIWLAYDSRIKPQTFFVFRIGTKVTEEVYGGTIKQPGWWTLAIAFDEKGVGHYYACSGIDNPTEKDELFDTTQFRTIDGSVNPTMERVAYSFFSLGYPTSNKMSPRFVIDDYEVWVIKW